MVTKVREIREKLVDLQVEIANLMEEPTETYRELDIISQKLEEAIMWTYRVVGLEKENKNISADNSKNFPKGEDLDVDTKLAILKYLISKYNE